MKKIILSVLYAAILFTSCGNNAQTKTDGTTDNKTSVSDKKLIFVYNADTGFFNIVGDVAHKTFSPKTYPCSLCGLTYGTFKMKPEWNAFVQKAPVPLLFLHKNEFYAIYPNLKSTPLPVIFIEKAGATSIFINQTELNGFKTIGELKQTIEERLTDNKN